MSRVDTKGIEHTSGYHGNFDRGADITAFLSLSNDRGGSQALGAYPASNHLHGGQTRLLGLKERDLGDGTTDTAFGPNRHNPNNQTLQFPPQPISALNHHLHLYRSPPSPHSHSSSNDQGTTLYQSPSLSDRDNTLRQPQSFGPILTPSASYSRSTLLWGNIEPWMDEEYAKQVCGLMGWDPVNIKVPHPPPDPTTGQQANNPGYCFLTFPTPAHAASVLAQINNNGKAGAVMMPNSSKPFVLNWAPALPPSAPLSNGFPSSTPAYIPSSQQYQKEYSIFVGDLAPETSNSDLVAVFRNPVLGLRNDREPKFIRPFLSCKSAKIMLDPVTGVSRGYGFVRFTDEADQQRALIEMHGLYCLSRPMRISPATAKFKPPPPMSVEFQQGQFNPAVPGTEGQPVAIALPLSTPAQAKSVSAPIASTNSNSSIGSNSTQGSSSTSSVGGSSSAGSLSSNAPSTISHGFSNHDANGVKLNGATGVPSLLSEAQLRQVLGQTDGYLISEESWKHHAQARAILGNLIGPNGEQLTSTDPYNTTVFVGGLSPLISEDTLRTFFAPFGDIHYVKVPVGKHCGFVQFVRKADAERAIEKMQGFPIGGSRIRLSWGRSQYKAAQAAAQAAQAAALQAQYSPSALPTSNGMTSDQAIQLLQRLTQQGYLMPIPGATNGNANISGDTFTASLASALVSDSKFRPGHDSSQSIESFSSNGFLSRPDAQRILSNFSPFSPDPTSCAEEGKPRETSSFCRSDTLPQSKAYTTSFYPPQLQTQDLKLSNGSSATEKISPSTRPTSAPRYGPYLEMSDRLSGRPEPISRPSSGQTSAPNYGDVDNDLEDLNGTLASLELDRPWKSPELPGSNSFQPAIKPSPPKKIM